MTPKFDVLLGQVREGGDAAPAGATPQIGDLRYSVTNPGPGWLKCDGKVYDRSAYPSYEALRPDPAWRFALLAGELPESGPGSLSPNFFEISGKYVLYQAATPETNNQDVLVSYDPATGLKAVLDIPNMPYPVYGFAGVQFPSGRAVLFFEGSTSMWVSENGGATWTEQTDAFSEAFPNTHQSLKHLTPNNCLNVPVPGGTKVLRVYDAGESGVFPSVTDVLGTNPAAVVSDAFAFSSNLFDVVIYPTAWSGYFTLVRAAPFDVVLDESSNVFSERRLGSMFPGDWHSFGMERTAKPRVTDRGIVSPYSTRPPVIVKGPVNVVNGDPVSIEFLTSNLRSNGNRVVKAEDNQILFSEYDFETWNTPAVAFGFLPSYSTAIERFAVAVHPDLQDLAGAFQYHDIGFEVDLKKFVGGQTRNILDLWDAAWEIGYRYHVYLDPTKFHAPGLSPVGDAWPYVYAGA